jgi:hypothetical protein
VKRCLRRLAVRISQLNEEINAADHELDRLTRELAPTMRSRPGFGPETTAQLLITAGDNPDRIGSEAALAGLCGVSPVPASSGRTRYHRLNRGGDRQANRARMRVPVPDHRKVDVVAATAAGQHGVELLPGFLTAHDAMHGVGGDTLRSVHGAGVTELHRGLDIGGGQGDGATIPHMPHC